MTDTHFQYIKPRLFLTLVVFLSINLYLAAKYVSASLVLNLSITAIITFLFIVIDKYFWRYPPFKWLYWVPDMSGRYEGEIRYINPATSSPDRKNCVIEVFQTGSKLKVSCFFQHQTIDELSTSKSLTESITKEEDGCYSIIFNYLNEGTRTHSQGQPHYGTCILKFINNGEGRILQGNYYTNREPQTKGIIEVQYQSNNLKNNF